MSFFFKPEGQVVISIQLSYTSQYSALSVGYNKNTAPFHPLKYSARSKIITKNSLCNRDIKKRELVKHA